MNVKKISVENGPAGKHILHVTDAKGVVHSFESGDATAAVPDTTKDSGVNVMEMQDDAQKPHDAANAEYDAAQHTDTPEAVEKANESWFNKLFGLEDGSEAPAETTDAPKADDNTTAPAAPETPAEPAPAAAEATEEPAVSNDAGEVSAPTDDTLVVEMENEVLTIQAKPEAAEETPATPAPAQEKPEQAADCGGAGPAGTAQAAAATATESLNQTFEAFLAGL